MKCVCSKDDLNDALSAVSSAVAVKPSTPILSGIYMRTVEDAIEFQATNFEISVVARVRANVEQDGATITNGRILASIVQKFSGDIVTITNENDPSTVALRSEAAAFDLNVMDADDFPLIHRESPTHTFRINKESLIRLITHSVFACAKADDGRPIFTGCFFDISGSSVNVVATNASRIAIVSGNILDELDSLQFIVPAFTLRSLLAMLYRASDSTVSVAFSANEVTFSFDDISFTSRLIDGAFPPYDKVIPETSSTSATINLRALRSAVDRMLIIAREADYQTLRFAFSQEGLELSSTSHSLGTSVEHLDSDVTGDDIALSFNFNFLADALKVFNSDPASDITFAMTQPLAPVKISADADSAFTYILTPLRTQ